MKFIAESLASELGSGVRNFFKYTAIYTPGAKPEFIEGDIFKTVIPLVGGTVEKSSEIGWEKILNESLLANQIGCKYIAQ
ncbi:MAG: hypothetical protein WDZ35_06765 [Crocinitomicaceae bacterium]